MLASARRRACAAGYRLPAAARLRAICRAGDLARRKPRAAAAFPGGRERPPYIRRQTCGKIENGRLPQSPRNEFRFRQNCTEPHTTPAQGRMLASARRRACAAGYRLPAAARLRAICRPGDLARRKPSAAASSPGGRERPPYLFRQTNGKTGNGRPPSLHDECPYKRKLRCGRHPRVGADACIRPPPGLCGGIPFARRRPPAGDLQGGRSRPPKTQRRRKLPRRA